MINHLLTNLRIPQIFDSVNLLLPTGRSYPDLSCSCVAGIAVIDETVLHLHQDQASSSAVTGCGQDSTRQHPRSRDLRLRALLQKTGAETGVSQKARQAATHPRTICASSKSAAEVVRRTTNLQLVLRWRENSAGSAISADPPNRSAHSN